MQNNQLHHKKLRFNIQLASINVSYICIIFAPWEKQQDKEEYKIKFSKT